jgi:hypothetical protein
MRYMINRAIVTSLALCWIVSGLASALAEQQIIERPNIGPGNRPYQQLPPPNNPNTPPNTPPRSPPIAGKPPSETEQLQTLHQEVQALKARLGTLERNFGNMQNQLSTMNSRSTFSCRGQNISINGAGVQQNCAPFRCQPIDGRCMIACSSVNDCTDPSVCNSAGRCVPPPR